MLQILKKVRYNLVAAWQRRILIVRAMNRALKESGVIRLTEDMAHKIHWLKSGEVSIFIV